MIDRATRAAYPSDISDRQWREIKPLMPPERERGRRRGTDLREVINGLNYRWATGCVWRMLPHDLPPWATVYTYYRRWQLDGTLREIRDVLLSPRAARRQRTKLVHSCEGDVASFVTNHPQAKPNHENS